MDELEELKVLINAETAQFKRELKKVQQEVKGATKVVDKETAKMSNSFKKMGGFIKGALIGLGLLKLGKEAIEMASNIDEVQNVVETAFGSMTPLVEKFAKTAIDQFGMSELTFKRTASTMMAMSRGMGFVGREAADMAIEVTKLSGDMASFFNVRQDVAETALKSIWTGETESLKRFGVVMTQTNLQQFAMRNGMNSNIQAMSQQEQLMLRYKFVTESLSLAQGDFVKTQDSWANQTRILSERFKELLAVLGSGLIQLLLPIIKLLNTVLSLLVNIGKALIAVFGNSTSTAKNFKAINTASVGAGTTGAPALGKLGNATEKAGKQAKGALAPFDDLNILASNLSESAKEAGNGLGGVSTPNLGKMDPLELNDEKVVSQVDVLTEKIKGMVSVYKDEMKKALVVLDKHFGGAWNKFVNGAKSNFKRAMDIGVSAWGDMKGLNKPIKKWIDNHLLPMWTTTAYVAADIFNGILDSVLTVSEDFWKRFTFPIAKNFAETILPLTADFFKKLIESAGVAFEQIKVAFDLVWKDVGVPILDTITTAWIDTVNGINDYWQKYGKSVFEEINKGFQATGEALEKAWKNLLKPVFDLLKQTVDSLWNGFLKPIVGEVVGLLTEIGIAVFKLWNGFLMPLTKNLSDVFGPAFKFTFGLIGGAVKDAIDFIGGLIAGILQVFKGVVQFVTGVFSGDWKKAWQGVVNIFSGIWNGLKGIVKGVWDFIIGLFSNGGKIFGGIVKGIGGIFKNIINTLLKGINWVIKQPFNVINGVLNFIKDINLMGFKPFNGLWGYDPIPAPQIPYLDVGTNYVARDGLAYIHQGEAVVPKKFNSQEFFGMGNTEQIELLKEQNALLRALLEKDNGVYLNGKDIRDENAKLEKRLNKRMNYE